MFLLNVSVFHNLQDFGTMALSVVREKQLSVLNQSSCLTKMELWVTNKLDTDIEAVLQCTKSFTEDIRTLKTKSPYIKIIYIYLV